MHIEDIIKSDSLVSEIKVIVYATKSGSYMKSQLQKYILYEYIPM